MYSGLKETAIYIPWCKVFVVSDFTAVRERFILQIINEFEMLLVL